MIGITFPVVIADHLRSYYRRPLIFVLVSGWLRVCDVRSKSYPCA